MRPVIVGEAPSMRTSRPLAGSSGERLAALAGTSLEGLNASFSFTNLLGHWPGPSPGGKGSAFPIAEARAAARGRRIPEGSLLLGRRVARAFGIGGAPYLEWVQLRGRRVAVVPHPSGVCRWWNDPANAERARTFMRDAAGDSRGR